MGLGRAEPCHRQAKAMSFTREKQKQISCVNPGLDTNAFKIGGEWLLSIMKIRLGWVARAGINKKAKWNEAGVWLLLR